MAKRDLYENVYNKQFSFGKNWKKFLEGLDERKIQLATKSLQEFTSLKSFSGKTFLDIGCGSGLFSLAAARLGARVVSVDVDANSLACAEYLREKYRIPKGRWEIRKGSALDRKAMHSLANLKADIVYSWGVLHHTGDMYKAFDNVAQVVAKKKLFYLAIYNTFNGFISSKSWLSIKKFYSKHGKFSRLVLRWLYTCYFCAGMLAHGKNPFSYINGYAKKTVRGMDFFRDVEDWLGGYPYEYATRKEVENYFAKRGFILVREKLTAREGCNEFLFVKD